MSSLDQPHAEGFRRVVGSFLTGVAVITTRADGVDHGMTANAVTSLSLEPPSMLVCLNRASATCTAVTAAGAFVVNILAEHQLDLATRFARPSTDKFAGVPVRRTDRQLPVLEGALATLACRVVETHAGATHEIVAGEVELTACRDGRPLAFYRGRLGGFEPQQAARPAAQATAAEALLEAELLWGPQRVRV